MYCIQRESLQKQSLFQFCYFRDGKTYDLYCRHMKITLTSNLTEQHKYFKLWTNKDQGLFLNNAATFVLLEPQCQQASSCFSQFISWNEANNICQRQEKSLPSIHNTRDMRSIVSQIDKHQDRISSHKINKSHKYCTEKQTNWPGGFSSVKLSYHTIGIYIGLDLKVCGPVLYIFWFCFVLFCFFFHKLCGWAITGPGITCLTWKSNTKKLFFWI